MTVHVAFLRGMNVGGHRITNADLGAAFTALGFGSVLTFRASGNVIFESGPGAEGELIAAIEEGLEEALGYAVPTFLRGATELRAIADFEPFEAGRVAASTGKLQVSLLSQQPTEEQRDAILALTTGEDPLALTGRELYWLPSGGLLESELDLDAIDAITGPSTRRTMGTIEGIAAKLPR